MLRPFFSGTRVLCAAAALAFLAGCSGSGTSAIAPKPASWQNGRINALTFFRLNHNLGDHFKSFYACPATGPIVYASDTRNVINIYSGKLAGQAPCAQMTGVISPYGLYIRPGTHDLYVAEVGNVLVFHRGQTTPFNTYTDPSGQVVSDVTIAPDGTIIAVNAGQSTGPEKGSISTWIGGPHGGHFVGNFPTINNEVAAFVTVQKNGMVFFDGFDRFTDHGAIFFLSCPAGVCGAQRQLAHVIIGDSGGLASNSTGDLLVTDQLYDQADTFELPNPKPKWFRLDQFEYPTGMAFDQAAQLWFVANSLENEVDEYSYPSGTLIGTVPGNAGGRLSLVGVAFDP
jgi:hypothetical protein